MQNIPLDVKCSVRVLRGSMDKPTWLMCQALAQLSFAMGHHVLEELADILVKESDDPPRQEVVINALAERVRNGLGEDLLGALADLVEILSAPYANSMSQTVHQGPPAARQK